MLFGHGWIGHGWIGGLSGLYPKATELGSNRLSYLEGMGGLALLSGVLGWSYFVAWSVSFYPQPWLNYKRKCVEGFSFEYLFYNLTGFFFYSLFTVVNYATHSSAAVVPNDVAFAVHAFVLTLLQALQCLIYDRRGQGVSRVHVLIIFAIWVLACYNFTLGALGVLPWVSRGEKHVFNVLETLGYSKSFISFVKYVPPALMNYRRKSTVGWSITNMLLDFTGGLLSILQQVVDSIRLKDPTIFSRNIPKLILGLESVMFDVIFIVQHYVLYTDRTDPAVAREPLLITTNDEATS